MIKRDFMGGTLEYDTIESSNHACPNWDMSPFLGIVCKHEIERPVPDRRQPRLDSEQCKAHTTFWITVVSLIPVWLLFYRPFDWTLPQYMFAAFHGNSDEPGHKRELAFLTIREDARKRGTRIKDARLLQLLFFGLHLYLHDTWCEVGIRHRFNTILGPHTEAEAIYCWASLFFTITRVLPRALRVMRWYLRPCLRFYVKIVGKRSHSLRKPEAVGLLAREIVFLSAYPMLGFLLTWPDEDTLALGGGKWSLSQLLFIFLISSHTEMRYDDFDDDEVNLVEECYNPDIGYCSICGNLVEDFEDRLCDWISRSSNNNAEAGLDSTPLLKQWLCLQCEGSDG